MPAYVEFHAARNMGAGFLRNAFEGLVNFGETRKAGDVRLLYIYAVKEGNSMISEVTDDYVGTNTGVNMRTHEIRVDVGLSRFLAWQNLFFIQNEISGNDPAPPLLCSDFRRARLPSTASKANCSSSSSLGARKRPSFGCGNSASGRSGKNNQTRRLHSEWLR